MTEFSSTKIPNCNDDGSVPKGVWCRCCGNSGVCVLEGSVWVQGVEYSRGTAPCKWCDQGVRRYAEWSRSSGARKAQDATGHVHVSYHRQTLVATDYTLADVTVEELEPRRRDRYVPTVEFAREREAAGCSRRALRWILPRSAIPPEWADSDPTEAPIAAVEPRRRR